MGRKAQTIYEYFKEYPEEMIDKVISNLSTDDKILLVIRYGEDLHNPCPKKNGVIINIVINFIKY